jgi:starch synthase
MATRIIGVVVPPLYHHSLGHDPPPPRLLTSSGCSRVAAFEERARGANGRGDNNNNKKNGGFLFPSSLSPSCKIRSRNSSANQKKPQARRVRGRPMPEVNSVPGEEGRESPVREQDIQNETSMDAESLSAEQQQRGSSSINSEGGGDEEGIFNPVSVDVVTSNGSMSDSSPKKKTGSFKDKGVSGVSVDELMIMMKDAENNIMLLNQVRERALEELQQVRNERDKLQSQVQVLQVFSGPWVFWSQ